MYACQNPQAPTKKRYHLISFAAINPKIFIVINNYTSYYK